MTRVTSRGGRAVPPSRPAAPSAVADVLLQAGIGTDPALLQPVPADTHTRRFAGADLVVDLALDGEGRRRTRLEVQGRRWAAQAGVGTPEVLAATGDGSWLVARRGAAAQPTAPVLDLAVAAALAVEAGPRPPQGALSSWRASRWTLPGRAVRLARARVPLRAFVAARAQAAGLPADAVAHGDYHLGNLLLDDAGQLLLVDWEFLGPAPHGTDLMRLWSTLAERDARDHVLERALAGTPAARRPQLAVLGRWLALRGLAEAAQEPDPADRVPDLARARAVLADAQALGARCR
jgi:hypothetical protein